MKKDRETLESELRSAKRIEDYLTVNRDSLRDESFEELIARTFRGKGITKAELSRRSNSSTVYIHQVFAGRRCPSRDKLLCLCIGMSAELDETQELLLAAGYAPLRADFPRDVVIMHGLIRWKSLEQINDKLSETQLEQLD